MATTITVTKTAEDAASKNLRVTIPVERVEEATTKAVRQYAKRARLPGFRQGKAPEAVVRRRFSNEIRQWVIEEVIREGWEEAKTSESLKPIGDPSIRNLGHRYPGERAAGTTPGTAGHLASGRGRQTRPGRNGAGGRGADRKRGSEGSPAVHDGAG